MSAPTKKKKKKRAKTQKASFSPLQVDFRKAFRTIDNSSESGEDKETMKEVFTLLAFMADKNGEVQLDDEIISFNSSLLKRE